MTNLRNAHHLYLWNVSLNYTFNTNSKQIWIIPIELPYLLHKSSLLLEEQVFWDKISCQKVGKFGKLGNKILRCRQQLLVQKIITSLKIIPQFLNGLLLKFGQVVRNLILFVRRSFTSKSNSYRKRTQQINIDLVSFFDINYLKVVWLVCTMTVVPIK